MADWKEQLANIQKLRQQRSDADQTLYSSQTNLIKAKVTLERATRQMTAPPTDLAVINALKLKITVLQSDLQNLDVELNAINADYTRLTQLTAEIDFLQKKSEAMTPQLTDLSRQLRDTTVSPRVDRVRSVQIQRQVDAQKSQLDEVKANITSALAEQKKLAASQRAAATRKTALEKQRNAATVNIDRLNADLADKVVNDHISPVDAEKRKKDWEVKKVKAKETVGQYVTNLQDAIAGIYVDDPHPRRAITNLDDNIPFLLLPVRIETKFMTVANSPQLLVRVYPDDISIHTHEKVLTDKEVQAGTKYWTAIFAAEKNGGANKEDRKKEAWSTLVRAFGSSRSSWIAKETKPTNWDSNAEGLGTAEQLTFPPHDLTSTNAWSRAPRADVLPDRFVVMLYQGETLAKEFVGELIPDQLFLGPDPMDADAAFVKNAEEMLAFGEGFDWTADFDKAVSKGMGFRIPLTQDESSKGFDKILVLGTFLSADHIESKSLVETLIDNHHYAPDGFSIVTQGTSTNNTEQDGSGFTTSDPLNTTSYFVETGEPLFDIGDNCDGKNLADALGIEYAPLQYILNANAKDLDEAVAMNKALYPSTLGYYFDTMMKPVLDANDQHKLRSFFTQYVTGRGPLPAVRVGNQPYGILLTSDFSKWKSVQTESTWGNKFLDTLFNVLNHFHSVWKNLSSQLLYTGKPGTDPSEVLMNILGLQSGSVSFFQRVAFSTENLLKNGEFMADKSYLKDLQNNFLNKRILQDFLVTLGYNLPAAPVELPQLLRLVFHHRQTQLDADNIIDNVPLSEKDGIRYYDETNKKNYIHWLMENNAVAALEKQDFTPGKVPTTLLFMQLRRSLLLELNRASVRWFGKSNITLDQVLEPLNFQNISTTPEITKWEVMKAKVSVAQPRHPQAGLSVADHLLTTGRNEADAAFLNEMKDSLQKLANLPTARLERCFTEHLDTCTYRLDAWQTALFNQRLQKQRLAPDGTLSKGVFLGAYGCVFDVRPAAKRTLVSERLPSRLQPADNKPLYEYVDNGGFVHAPSINQATAAAVLRSGYLNHASSANPDTMAVNLSSERVRLAMLVLDGIRKGQSLEALLGYQFERGLHDRGSADNNLKRLNEYIYNFRDKYQIEQNLVQQQGSSAGAEETIKANNVVNGLTLAETTTAYPYGVSLNLSGLTSLQQTAISNAIIGEKDKLNDTLDAVKDLLLSESVYQMVQGNFDRTAAVTNALKDAHIPPEIEIVNTPKSTQLTFTNRVTIQFEPIQVSAGVNPWAPVPLTSRARIEPGINRWLGRVLGSPTKLSCLVYHGDDAAPINKVDVTIDKLGIQPIDLVYIAGSELNTGDQERSGLSELEQRIAVFYRRDTLLDNDTKVSIRFMETVAVTEKRTLGSILPLLRMLKSVINDSRPLNASDFDPASKQTIADKTNPKGYIPTELRDRIVTAFDDFAACFNGVTKLTIAEVTGGPTVTLGEFFALMDGGQLESEDVTFVFESADAHNLQNFLIRIANFGIADAFPSIVNVFDDSAKSLLLRQARDTIRKMENIMGRVTDFISTADSSADKEEQVMILTEAGKALFGAVFNVLPQFTYNIPEDIKLSKSDDSLLNYAKQQIKMDFPAEEWLQKFSHVRPRLARWEYVRTLYELNQHDSLDITPVQLPYRAKDSWIAVEFPPSNEDGSPFTIVDDTLSIVIHGDAGSAATDFQSGLLIDDWTEVLPNRQEITGLTFNYNQPNAMAPQALLLAVTPLETGKWSWDNLVGVVNDTFLRAKLRAVEPAMLDAANSPDVGVLLPALISNFSKHDLDFSLDYARNIAYIENNIPLTTINFN
ncbi:MAG: hypothetical protein ABJA70_05630 [Chryseolinea sp.]